MKLLVSFTRTDSSSMFIPVDDDRSGISQSVWKVSKDKDGKVSKQNICGVRYVKLTDPPGH